MAHLLMKDPYLNALSILVVIETIIKHLYERTQASFMIYGVWFYHLFSIIILKALPLNNLPLFEKIKAVDESSTFLESVTYLT